jgi:hypothetical protein
MGAVGENKETDMMPQMSQYQPQSILQLLIGGFQLWKNSFSKALPFILLIGLLNIILQLEVASTSMHFFEGGTGILDKTQKLLATETNQDLTTLTGSLFAIMIAALILHAGMTYRIHAFAHGKLLAFDKSFYAGCKKAFSIVGIYVLCSLTVTAGLMLLVLPGIIIAVYMLFSYFLVVMTDRGIIDALRESVRLISGSFWRTMGIFLLMMLIYIAFSLSLIMLFNFIPYLVAGLCGLEALPEDFKYYYPVFLSTLIIIVLYPLFTACLLTLLYDLQNRKELGKENKPTHHIVA